MSEQPAKLDGLSGVLPTLTPVVDVVGSKLPPDPPSVLALIRERDALKARVAELEAQVPRWTSVTERLPEESGWYLVRLEYMEHACKVCFLKEEDKIRSHYPTWSEGSCELELEDITHWMPLPPAPKEVK